MYDRKPERVHESDRYRNLWDFPIRTDKQLKNNRPDIVDDDKVEKTSLQIDPARLFNTRITKKKKKTTVMVCYKK